MTNKPDYFCLASFYRLPWYLWVKLEPTQLGTFLGVPRGRLLRKVSSDKHSSLFVAKVLALTVENLVTKKLECLPVLGRFSREPGRGRPRKVPTSVGSSLLPKNWLAYKSLLGAITLAYLYLSPLSVMKKGIGTRVKYTFFFDADNCGKEARVFVCPLQVFTRKVAISVGSSFLTKRG